MTHETAGQYFDIMGNAKKAYGVCLEPVCKKWDLTRNELDVLLFLYNNPGFDRAADIVSRRAIAKSHVSLAVSSLEKRGFLLRQADPADRRTVSLLLTDQGRSAAIDGHGQQDQYFRWLFRGITPEQFQVWKEITEKIQNNLFEKKEG